MNEQFGNDGVLTYLSDLIVWNYTVKYTYIYLYTYIVDIFIKDNINVYLGIL